MHVRNIGGLKEMWNPPSALCRKLPPRELGIDQYTHELRVRARIFSSWSLERAPQHGIRTCLRLELLSGLPPSPRNSYISFECQKCCMTHVSNQRRYVYLCRTLENHNHSTSASNDFHKSITGLRIISAFNLNSQVVSI